MRPVVAILGPTAIGKTGLALELCRSAPPGGGEVVGADSRQVYRCMDIGTAKPTREETAVVTHHLIDVVDPDQEFSLALYQKLALEAIEDIQGRGKAVFLVGGSGLYLWSLLEGWRIPAVPPDHDLRQELEDRAEMEGSEALYSELKALDPVAADRIDPRNVRRVIRALEVCRQGIAFSQHQVREPFFPALIVGLTAAREDLYHRIDQRVDEMIERGLVEETEGLVARGYGFDFTSMSGLGYQQIGGYLRGEIDLPTAVQQIKYATHRFARSQYAWFRLRDPRIHWFDIRSDFVTQARALVQGFIEANCNVAGIKAG